MVKGEIPNITNIATTTALTTVKNKIPNVNDPVTKIDYNTKISEIEFNKLFFCKIKTNKISKQK